MNPFFGTDLLQFMHDYLGNFRRDVFSDLDLVEVWVQGPDVGLGTVDMLVFDTPDLSSGLKAASSSASAHHKFGSFMSRCVVCD